MRDHIKGIVTPLSILNIIVHLQMRLKVIQIAIQIGPKRSGSLGVASLADDPDAVESLVVIVPHLLFD